MGKQPSSMGLPWFCSWCPTTVLVMLLWPTPPVLLYYKCILVLLVLCVHFVAIFWFSMVYWGVFYSLANLTQQESVKHELDGPAKCEVQPLSVDWRLWLGHPLSLWHEPAATPSAMLLAFWELQGGGDGECWWEREWWWSGGDESAGWLGGFITQVQLSPVGK